MVCNYRYWEDGGRGTMVGLYYRREESLKEWQNAEKKQNQKPHQTTTKTKNQTKQNKIKKTHLKKKL